MSTHGPIEAEYRESMNALAHALDDLLKDMYGKRLGFAFLIYEFGQATAGRVNYISNSDRADMLCALKEITARMEGFDPKPGEEGHA